MKNKHRTNKSAKSRFRVSKNGVVMHRSHNIRHRRAHKSNRQIRSLLTTKTVTGTIRKKVLQLLGLH